MFFERNPKDAAWLASRKKLAREQRAAKRRAQTGTQAFVPTPRRHRQRRPRNYRTGRMAREQAAAERERKLYSFPRGAPPLLKWFDYEGVPQIRLGEPRHAPAVDPSKLVRPGVTG
jgi:hypothetical protein